MIVNGVTLPDIPAEVLEQYQYLTLVGTIGTNSQGTMTAYILQASNSKFAVVPPEMEMFDGESYTYNTLVWTEKSGASFLYMAGMYDSWTEEANYIGSTSPVDWTMDLTEINGTVQEFDLLATNHDICIATAYDIATQTPTVGTVVYCTATAGFPPGVEPSPTRYSIAKAILDAVARQIMRLTDSTAKVKPEEMAEKLEGVEMGEELPSAEDAIFGKDDGTSEYGMLSNGNVFSSASDSDVYRGWDFTAVEAFTVKGIRYQQSNGYKFYLEVWDSEGSPLRSEYTTVRSSEWTEIYFNEPLSISAGESYGVRIKSPSPRVAENSGTSFNSKLRDVKSTERSGFTYWPMIDIIIGGVANDLPDAYQIDRSTMDEIANEVKRITETTGKISTEQIVTALQGIPVQTAATEE